MVSPVTVNGDAEPEWLPGLPVPDVHDAVYEVIVLPPLLGAVNATEIDAFPPVTVGCAGALGTVAGMTAADAADGLLVPSALVAVTVHV